MPSKSSSIGTGGDGKKSSHSTVTKNNQRQAKKGGSKNQSKQDKNTEVYQDLKTARGSDVIVGLNFTALRQAFILCSIRIWFIKLFCIFKIFKNLRGFSQSKNEK